MNGVAPSFPSASISWRWCASSLTAWIRPIRGGFPARQVSTLRPESGDGHELLRERGQHFRLAVPDDHEILDPDPAQPRVVDAGLDGDDAADREDVVALRPHRRLLVHLDPQAVAEPVAEELAVAGVVDHLPRDRVDVAPRPSGPCRLEPGELAREADVVGAHELVRERPGRERPRAVRVVAAELRGGVDDDRLALLDRDVA